MWKKVVLGLLSLLFVFILVIGYLFSTLNIDSKDNEDFCTQYIPLLEVYYKKNNQYPEKLSDVNRVILNPKFSNNSCGYSRKGIGYYFIISRGMGIAGYDSIKQAWWYD